jgi:hypothetical protein
MLTPHRVAGLVYSLALVAASAATPCATAQEPPATAQSPAEREKTKRLDFFRQRLATLKVAAVDRREQPFEFAAEPLIAFENPVSQMWDGLMFVWTDRGRPAAAVKCYYHSINKRWGRTFVSLSPERIEVVSGDKKLWTPESGGLSFAPLASASTPAGDERRRLTQMRQIARRFTMVDRWGLKDPTDYQLRLLPTPLFRYASPDDDVVDGALFGYVVNSPEALVLIEARKTDEGLAWHYAVARFTRFEVTVSLDGKQIAEFRRLEAWPPTGVYFHDPVEMPDYPFARTAEPATKKK